MKHVCKPMKPFCTCNVIGLEPTDSCEIHTAYKSRKRCSCGQFCKEYEEPCENFIKIVQF